MTAIQEEQEEHRDGYENSCAPERERGDVILVGGFGGNEIDEFVENHGAADAEGRRCEEGQEAIACAKGEDECGWDYYERSGEEMVKQVAGRIDVLEMDEMEIKALTDEGQQHGDEDEEQSAFWSEVIAISIDCFAHAHGKED
jgi:hypothetical protein